MAILVIYLNVQIGVEPNEENRKRFRNMMFHADKKIGENLGGVILHHETIYQTDDNGKRNCSVFTDYLWHIHIFEYLNNSL